MVPVLFGVGLILIFGLMVDGLGRGGTVWAALAAAISPAMVFYSRYYIHAFFALESETVAMEVGKPAEQGKLAKRGNVNRNKRTTENELEPCFSAPVDARVKK